MGVEWWVGGIVYQAYCFLFRRKIKETSWKDWYKVSSHPFLLNKKPSAFTILLLLKKKSLELEKKGWNEERRLMVSGILYPAYSFLFKVEENLKREVEKTGTRSWHILFCFQQETLALPLALHSKSSKLEEQKVTWQKEEQRKSLTIKINFKSNKCEVHHLFTVRKQKQTSIVCRNKQKITVGYWTPTFWLQRRYHNH